MDVKALAKSKRGHTQHHKKAHHSHKFKSPSPSSSSSPSGSNVSAKNLLAKPQVNDEKKTRRSALPSNWDRYEEEGEESEFGPESGSKTLDAALPKSKGADFQFLVAEAQSHAETSFESFPSFDDHLPGEFRMGLSSMLVVRGEGIVSWAGDDNFVVEDKTSGNPEASFMSLNLHALAESLAKVDLSKRLFIEPDLIPTELCVDDLKVGSKEEHELETTVDSDLANRMSEDFNLDDFAAEQFTSSSSHTTSNAASIFTLSNESHVPVNSVSVEFPQVSSSSKTKPFLLSSDANLHSSEDTRFVAAAAEKELDMLLDSLDETKILDSPGFKSNTAFSVSVGVSSVDPPQVSKKDPFPSKTSLVTGSLDDALDDLLEETSTLMKPNVLSRPPEEKPVQRSMQSSSQSGIKSTVSDDFDSWFDTL